MGLVAAALLVFSCTSAAPTEPQPSSPPKSSELDRSVLPIIEPSRPVYTELDVRDTVPPPRFELEAPEGAPNVVVVLVDDLGFAGTGAFGGPIDTPTFDHHVIDVAPTILEAAGLPEPKVVNTTPQRPMDGVSMVYTFDDATAKDRHVTQYFEMFGNRAMYHDGWFARTIHRAPWETEPRRPLAEDVWELYDTRSDFSLVNDLASKMPDKLAELQALFMKEAEANHVLPIDDRVLERVNAALAGRPDLMAGRTTLTLAEGMTGMSENVFLNVKNKSKTITAELEVPEGAANGAILVQGGRFGG